MKVNLCSFCLLMLTPLLLAGCGGGGNDGPPLGRVTGTITVNQTPVAGLTVYFEPMDTTDGATAMGVTDENGRYTLTSPGNQPGAVVGKNLIRVQGRMASASDEMLAEIAADQGVTVEELKKLPVVPPEHNEQSQRVVTVEAGSNKFDFDLPM